MFFTSAATKHLLVKTEGIVQHSTVMALTSPWQDSPAAASDDDDIDAQPTKYHDSSKPVQLFDFLQSSLLNNSCKL